LHAVTDPPTRVTFVADPVVIIKTKIRDESIVLNAVNTTDVAAITPSWARCFFLISAGNGYPNSPIYPCQPEVIQGPPADGEEGRGARNARPVAGSLEHLNWTAVGGTTTMMSP